MPTIDEVRKNIILKDGIYYFDYTASGLAYAPIEDEISKFLKTYANTHTDSSSSAVLTQKRYENARAELKELLKLEFKNSVRYFKIVEKMPRNQQGKFEKSEFENALFASHKPVWSGGAGNEVGEICSGQIYGSSDNLGSGLNCGANDDSVKFDASGERLDGAQKYEFSAIIHAGLEIFESHFPNLPLLPGFMQLDFVFELASRVGIDVNGASTVENLKFMKFVRPGDALRVCFEKRGGKLYFELFCNGEKCSTGRATL